MSTFDLAAEMNEISAEMESSSSDDQIEISLPEKQLTYEEQLRVFENLARNPLFQSSANVIGMNVSDNGDVYANDNTFGLDFLLPPPVDAPIMPPVSLPPTNRIKQICFKPAFAKPSLDATRAIRHSDTTSADAARANVAGHAEMSSPESECDIKEFTKDAKPHAEENDICCSAIRGTDKQQCENFPRCYIDGNLYCRLHAQWRLRTEPIVKSRDDLERLVKISDFATQFDKLIFTKVNESFIALKYYWFPYEAEIKKEKIKFKSFWYFCESSKLYVGDIINGKPSESYLARITQNTLKKTYEPPTDRVVIGYYWLKTAKIITEMEYKRNICKIVKKLANKKNTSLNKLYQSLLRRWHKNKKVNIYSTDLRHICDVVLNIGEYMDPHTITYESLMLHHFNQSNFSVNMMLLAMTLIKDPLNYPWLK
jgi:hypothetical protein